MSDHLLTLLTIFLLAQSWARRPGPASYQCVCVCVCARACNEHLHHTSHQYLMKAETVSETLEIHSIANCPGRLHCIQSLESFKFYKDMTVQSV
jgi:hypothetical protein